MSHSTPWSVVQTFVTAEPQHAALVSVCEKIPPKCAYVLVRKKGVMVMQVVQFSVKLILFLVTRD